MILVTVEVVVDPESVASVKSVLATMETASRAETGCITYAFSVDVNDPGMIRVTEKWKSMADLQAHFKMPHMAEFQKAVGALAPKSMDVKAYEVSGEVALPF